TDAQLAAEVRRLRQGFDPLPYARPEEPPAGVRGRILDAPAARAPSTGEEARPGGPPPPPVGWSRLIAGAGATLAPACGFQARRTRQELALQREVTAALQEPNVLRSFALAGTGPASGAVGRVSLDLDAKKGAVVLKGMPVLPAGEVYRLWAAVGDKSVPCG